MAKKFLRSNLKDDAEREMVNFLIEKGVQIMEKAYETRGFENRTGNLHDSYGCAVYNNGMYVNQSVRTLTPIAVKTKKVRGRYVKGHNEVERYLKHIYRPRAKGLSLVVVAAMPYGEILEHGWGNLQKKYRVIAGINSDMASLSRELEGRFGIRKRGVTITGINP